MKIIEYRKKSKESDSSLVKVKYSRFKKVPNVINVNFLPHITACSITPNTAEAMDIITKWQKQMKHLDKQRNGSHVHLHVHG